MRSNIKKVFFFYFLLFAILIVYLLFFTFFKSKNIIGNSYNPRVKIYQNTGIIKGSILDRNFNILAETTEKRNYPYKNIFAHTVGFIDKGGYGIESKFNFNMQILHNELWQRLKKEFNNNNLLKGNSLVLTLDKELQKYCYDKLKNKKGSIIVMDSTTGEILSMVSSPSFDPNNVSKNWKKLNSDKENNPFINRATQGLYPPASVFKILTAATFIENYPNWQNYTYECKGYETYQNITIECFNKKAHNKINLEKALAVSCNSFFVNLSTMINPNDLVKTANKALFNTPLNIPLEYKQSSFVLNDKSSIDEIMQTYIGQGKTLVTPMHIAMIGSSIANNGIMMKPYIISSELDYNGNVINKTIPKKLTNAFNIDTAQTLKNMLQKVITEGTGKKAQIKDISISAKTGTAQVQGKKDHVWFLGMAPTESPKIVVCIMFENEGANSNIINIARDIIYFCKSYFNL